MYVLLFTSLALVGAGVTLGFTGQRMLQMRLGQSGLQNYDSMRFYTQRRALAIVAHQPLGMGPGQSEEVLGYSTHSMYLRILAENGVPGFLIFYSLVGAGLARALRLALSQEDSETTDVFAFVSACLIGTLINGLVIDTIHWRHFWLLIAMAWCSSPAQERSYCPVSFSTTAPSWSRFRISTV